ncbi:MAG: tRNA (guanosine(46)-N7)-methyltransferase TrmB [Gammaproteobacteria bacterium]|nr:tRNA (guanosine(46)-N7)-methyltransferase TrmB [Gammaproteobacteria bacterium]MCW8958863.1 tRNA (guanosine(46)-N7)-methyltransferase TrmB [Gammaproteobacteria bacterium]MCW8972568.1 tRNA (guanosine(46)-N7)-methyltransferase TrmB [Gammaproteobacteria bacterium]MCW8993179.1 tRNA (guanosine(46)-N7)-methyltransferase TrmB [Gammaproteobacteria bacterium]
MNDTPYLRRIRSFVRREGRLTPGQQRAMEALFPRFGIETGEQLLNLEAVFGRHAPRILEIGFGNGESLAEIAKNHPQNDYIGIEVHRPGVGQLLMRIEEMGLSNVRVMCGDAVDILEQQIPDESLDALYLFFPDPWHKKRHHKRRQVQPAWAQLVHRKLKTGGTLHMATDWQHYAEQMLDVLSNLEGFRNLSTSGDYVPKPDYRPETRFERRGRGLGHGVWDLLFEKLPPKTSSESLLDL